MESIFLSPFGLYEAQFSVLTTYFDTLAQTLHDRALMVLPVPESPEKTEGTFQLFAFKNLPRHHVPNDTHEVTYYDFHAHQEITPEEYYKKLFADIQEDGIAISKELQKGSQHIIHVFPRYRNRAFHIIDTYIQCLRSSVFNHEHYRRYRMHHIGVQGREDNVIYAFTYSPEEMEIYKTLAHLEDTWEKEKVLITHGLNRLMLIAENQKKIQLRISLALIGVGGGDSELSRQNLSQNIEKMEGYVSYFLSYIQGLDIRNYKTSDIQTLESLQEQIRGILGKKLQLGKTL